MKLIASYILVSVFILSGCSTREKQKPLGEDADSLAVINLSDDVTKVESLLLSEAMHDVQVVPLEATNESLLAYIANVQVTDNDIWVDPGNNDQRIYRFSRSGKFLNFVGKIGQGPEEYTGFTDFIIDEKAKEIYIVTTSVGVKVYDFDGNYKRRPTNEILGQMFHCAIGPFLLFDDHIFISQHTYVSRPINNPVDSLWSVALVDSSFQKQKLFKNPAHIGKEELLAGGRAKPETWENVNYLTEGNSTLESYGSQFTLKFPDTDTIYQYNVDSQEFIPRYAIESKEEKGDYELTHQWIKERKALDYFLIRGYYQSKDFIYLVANKGENIYTYCYNKHDGKVTYKVDKGNIIARKLPWFANPHLYLVCPFVFDNDITGGDFTVDHRSSGKYWVDVLIPFSEDKWIDMEAVKASSVIDEAKKEAFVNCLENANEDSNPILLIGVLK